MKENFNYVICGKKNVANHSLMKKEYTGYNDRGKIEVNLVAISLVIIGQFVHPFEGEGRGQRGWKGEIVTLAHSVFHIIKNSCVRSK